MGSVDHALPEIARPPKGLAPRAQYPAPYAKGRRPRQPPTPAETGRPETGTEFAARVKDRFVLRGPRERPEGGMGTTTQPTPIPIPENDGNNMTPDTATPMESETRRIAPVTYPHDEHLLQEAKGRYKEDSFFQKILDTPKAFKNFSLTEDGFIRLKLPDRIVVCIPDIKIGERTLREMVIDQAHSLLAHLGAKKTLSYLREYVWWDSMVHDVTTFCASCTTCQRSKLPNQKPYGLLNPLTVPSMPWDTIGVDFVGPLPESKDRDGSYDSITVIIDLLTTMIHLVPSRTTYTAKDIAELMFAEVYKLHGLPRTIVSDRDVLFMSLFWTHLNKLMGIKQCMSSAYHPETDGSTEHANRTIGQMLRSCIGPTQKDWVSKLPAIEFAINLARSESTGYSPFFLNTGRMPRAMIWDAPGNDEYPSVKAYAQRMKLALTAAHDALLTARVKQTVQANKRRRTCPFVVGDLVYISTKNISFPKGTARKLVPKFVGPYMISQDFGNYSYRIELPSSLRQRGIHDVFHSSLLRIHIPNDDQLFPGRLDEQIPELGGTAREWTVDKILSHQGSHSDAKFEVLWTSGDKTWLPYGEIAHLRALTDYFEILGVNNITQLTDNNIGDALDDDELDVAAGCISLCICRPNKYCPVHLDKRKQRSAPTAGRSVHNHGATPARRWPHCCPLGQPPVIPLTNQHRQTQLRHSSAGPKSQKGRQCHTKDMASNYARNN